MIKTKEERAIPGKEDAFDLKSNNLSQGNSTTNDVEFNSSGELLEASRLSRQPNPKTMLAGCFRTTLCTFCRRVLPDGSVRFNFTAACPNCFEKIEKFSSDLRRHKRTYAKKIGGDNGLKK